MKTVTVAFQNSSNKTQTETFDVYLRSELSKQEFSALLSSVGGANFTRLGSEEWEDEYGPEVEKEAACQAGYEGQNVIVVMK